MRILDSRDCVSLEEILEVLHSLLLVKITLDKVLEGSLGDATDLYLFLLFLLFLLWLRGLLLALHGLYTEDNLVVV